MLVKLKKPRQERRADLPTIGPATIRAAAAAGLAGIAVHAGNCLIIERQSTIEARRPGRLVRGRRRRPRVSAAMRPAQVFVLAGEPSGDMLGGRLLKALREQAGDRLEFFGVGGPRMAERGLDSLFPMDELSLIGFTEILPHLPRLARRLRETVARDPRRRPLPRADDRFAGFRAAPAAPARAACRCCACTTSRRRSGPGASSARRSSRATSTICSRCCRSSRRSSSATACPASFVGHPITEEAGRRGDGARFRRRYGIAADAPLLCVLPGSRRGEVSQHLPLLGEAVALLWRRARGCASCCRRSPGLAPLVKSLVADWQVPVLVLEDRAERFDAYAASRLAIAASGTVSLEAALARLPLITIYRTGPVTAWLARRLIKVPHVNLVNLILGRPAVPELLQEDCHPERIAATATRLLEDEGLRADQQAALAEATARLGARDGRPPSQCAAARVLEVMADAQPRRTA